MGSGAMMNIVLRIRQPRLPRQMGIVFRQPRQMGSGGRGPHDVVVLRGAETEIFFLSDGG